MSGVHCVDVLYLLYATRILSGRIVFHFGDDQQLKDCWTSLNESQYTAMVSSQKPKRTHRVCSFAYGSKTGGDIGLSPL